MYRLFVSLLLLGLLVGCGAPEPFRALASIEEPTAAPDFALTDQHGQPFRLGEQRGRLVLLFFGFTNCPDICPTALADMAAARRELGADAEEVQLVFVTVDPARDAPERLARYVRAFDPSIVALRGDDAALAAVYQSYGVVAIRRDLPDSDLQYTMDHTAAVYVIDGDGRWRGVIGHGAPVDDVVSDLRRLLRSA